MKKIAILSCLNATNICSGASCFSALNDRKAAFSCYDGDDIEVVAFFHCNGCNCDYDNDQKYLEKIGRICAMRPDAVHVGICTLINGKECLIISRVIQTLEMHGITVIRGTH